ncbi:MAG: putative mycofactocin-associated electron transfer flavoprotein, partial [Actinobacteria bacterium]|nr:putative mycofactocin-associated electron transfer flavoprotein [Actinomycetota bacterium]
MSTAPVVGVALKWAPLRVRVDPLTGVPADDPLGQGLSGADEAAL